MLPANNLEKFFEELENQFWTLIPVNISFATKLQFSANEKLNSGLFKPARLSQSDELKTEVRNDLIFWLDAKSEHMTEIDLTALLQLQSLTEQLKNHFRISLNEFECHFAVYPAGHFYKKHSDSTSVNNKRIFSFVIYLNDNWGPHDGGKLIGYRNEHKIFSIDPLIGNMIIFKSDLEHEVLISNRTRFSLTGWIRK